jgi:hypothetical protein
VVRSPSAPRTKLDFLENEGLSYTNEEFVRREKEGEVAGALRLYRPVAAWVRERDHRRIARVLPTQAPPKPLRANKQPLSDLDLALNACLKLELQPTAAAIRQLDEHRRKRVLRDIRRASRSLAELDRSVNRPS